MFLSKIFPKSVRKIFWGRFSFSLCMNIFCSNFPKTLETWLHLLLGKIWFLNSMHSLFLWLTSEFLQGPSNYCGFIIKLCHGVAPWLGYAFQTSSVRALIAPIATLFVHWRSILRSMYKNLHRRGLGGRYPSLIIRDQI